MIQHSFLNEIEITFDIYKSEHKLCSASIVFVFCRWLFNIRFFHHNYLYNDSIESNFFVQLNIRRFYLTLNFFVSFFISVKVHNFFPTDVLIKKSS